MTVEYVNPTTTKVFTGAGEYTFLFKTFDETDIKASHVSTTGVFTPLVYPTEYTVTLNALTDGGHIDVLTSVYSGGQLVITRELDLVQDVDLEMAGRFYPETLEQALDRNVMMMQQLDVVVSDLQVTSDWRGLWVTGTLYDLKDIIQSPDGNWYQCIEAHTAGTFATDLAAGKWLLTIDVSAVTDLKTVESTDSSVDVTYGATTIDLAVATIPDDAVTTDKILNGAVTAAKISGVATLVQREITGGTITKTGANQLTISACTCWDITNSIWLETTVDNTLTIPSAANTIYHIFLVRLVSGGTFEFRAYTTEAGVVSDAQVNAYRWRGFWRTNGSSNCVVALTVGDLMIFGKASENQVGALTGSFATISHTAFIPVTRVREIVYGVYDNGGTMGHAVSSIDGTNVDAVIGFGGTGDTTYDAWAALAFKTEILLPFITSRQFKLASNNGGLLIHAVRLIV